MAKYRVTVDAVESGGAPVGTEFEWDGVEKNACDYIVIDGYLNLEGEIELVEPDIASSVTPITEQKVVTEVTGVKLNVELKTTSVLDLLYLLGAGSFLSEELNELRDQLKEALDA